MSASAPDPRPARIWTPRLLGLADRRLDLAVTAAAAAVLAASRLLLLANGPWEQDEAIFARSLLDFAPLQHFPHPPFFPGWLALGSLLAPLVGEPLVALQLLSALASLLTLWPLAYLARRAAPAPLALACALGVQFLPGAWVFAVRGFSCTAAAFLALLAAAWLCRGGLAGARFLGFSAVIAAAFLVRPVLAPVLAVLWVAGAWRLRPRLQVVGGAALGLAIAVLGFLPFVVATGGPAGFVKAFSGHAGEHLGAVSATAAALADLGVVAAFGGVAGAAVAGALAVAGVAVWGARNGWRSAALYAALLVLLLALLLLAHVPTFPRYAVPLVLAVAPLIAAALAVLPTVAGTAVALALTAAAAVTWLPVLREQHATRFPMWSAALLATETAHAAATPTRPLGGMGGWAFVSYADALARARGGAGATPPPARWAPRGGGSVSEPHWVVATSSWAGVLPWERTRELGRFAGVSPRAERLTQHRFLTGFAVADLPLLRGTWWPPEKDGAGRVFAWCSSRSSMVLPAVEPFEPLLLTVRAARGELPLKVSVNRKLALAVSGSGALETHRIPSDALFTDRPNTIELDRDKTYPPNERDRRPLAAAVYVVTSARVSGAAVSLGDAERLRALGVTLHGFFGKETFRDGVVGRWSQPSAAIELPALAGRYGLTMLAPRPVEARAELRVGDTLVGGPWVVPTVARSYEFELPAALVRGPTVRLELRVTPYATPALPKRPSRTLGAVVATLTLPERAPGS